jgi:hypothetical protein
VNESLTSISFDRHTQIRWLILHSGIAQHGRGDFRGAERTFQSLRHEQDVIGHWASAHAEFLINKEGDFQPTLDAYKVPMHSTQPAWVRVEAGYCRLLLCSGIAPGFTKYTGQTHLRQVGRLGNQWAAIFAARAAVAMGNFDVAQNRLATASQLPTPKRRKSLDSLVELMQEGFHNLAEVMDEMTRNRKGPQEITPHQIQT